MDKIANMLTQLRNGKQCGKDMIEVSKSRTVGSILKVLKEEGFIGDYKEKDDKYEVSLLYDNDNSVITQLTRVSKSGCRKYVGWKDLRYVMGGRGIGIVSTSLGIMSIEDARRKKIGGEYICKVW